MNDYKSMQKRMTEQGATQEQIYEAVLAEKNRFILALQATIDSKNAEIARLRDELEPPPTPMQVKP